MKTRSTVSRPATGGVRKDHQGYSGKVCLFSHFDRDSVVRPHVFGYVEAILSAGFAVMFVSTADRITTEDRDRLEGLGADVHVRENKGIDFGSWQYGMNAIGDLGTVDKLLLANDSVFGPFFDLGFLFDQMDKTDADFWGITDSYEGRWHLQSYFLCFNKNVISSDVFADFFGKDFQSFAKRQTINHGEIGLSQELLQAGFKGQASCPYGALTDGKFDGPRNPTQHYWDELIENCGCPFLKVQLLRDNPNGVENLDRWREVMARATEYDISWIEDYLTAFRAAPSGRPMTRLVFSYLQRLPYAALVAIRAAAKAARHPIRALAALDQFVIADITKLPMHPAPRPRTAYIDLGGGNAGVGTGNGQRPNVHKATG